MFAADSTPTVFEPRLLRAGSLTAACSIGRSYVTGDWIAVGSVRSDDPPERLPVWILVGHGNCPDGAIDDLQGKLEQESLRFMG